MIKFVETTDIPLSKLENNNGQIEGLPKNPRYVRDYRFEKLVENIKKHPDMLALRELMVYQHGDKYIVYCGNMRLKALREIGYKSAPCKIIPPETPIDEIRAYIFLDNNPFGEWDMDILANEWDEGELVEWGMELPQFDGINVSPDDFGDQFALKDGDKEPFQQMTFTMADEQAELIKNAITDCKTLEEYKYLETFGNENTNGNALYLIVSQWANARK